MVEVYLHLLPKVQLHVSALDYSHLQVVHESLESSYTRFNMGCVQWGCGRWALDLVGGWAVYSEDVGDGHEIWWVDGLCTVRMWEMGTRSGGWMGCVQ